MQEYYDEKGKHFTDIVAKRPLSVILFTPSHTIQGEIYLFPNDRLIDDINQPEKFLAVTNAAVYSNSGELHYRTDFLSVNRDHITWIMPGKEVSHRPTHLQEAGI